MINVQSKANPLDDTIIERYAAIDLGSNSFHCLVMEKTPEKQYPIYSSKHRVRLISGINTNGNLAPQALERAMNALQQFAIDLQPLGPIQLRIVGTKALRQATNIERLLEKTKSLFGQHIDVIDGREEARLIFQGVSKSFKEGSQNLVIDIGGGSTEFIVGLGQKALFLDSLPLGCLSSYEMYFGDQKLDSETYEQAKMEASLATYSLRSALKSHPWQQAIGCSGCFESLLTVQKTLIPSEQNLTAFGIQLMEQKLLSSQTLDDWSLPELDKDRKCLLPASLAIVSAIFEVFNIDKLSVSNADLKDGIISDLQDKKELNFQREQAVLQLMHSYQADHAQSQRMLLTVNDIWSQISQFVSLRDPENFLIVSWAALLFEIGRSISSHDQQKHGAYLIQNQRITGFTQTQQQFLAQLILAQQGQIPENSADRLPEFIRQDFWLLLRILRLARIIRSNRENRQPAIIHYRLHQNQFQLEIQCSFHGDFTLMMADLKREIAWQKKAGLILSLQQI